MGSLPQAFSLVHDPLGLLALPMRFAGRDRPDEDGLQPGITTAKSLGMAIAAKTIVGALVAALVAVSLVALPGPTNNVSRSTIWNADEGLCQFAHAPLIFAAHHPLRDLFDPEFLVRYLTRSSP